MIRLLVAVTLLPAIAHAGPDIKGIRAGGAILDMEDDDGEFSEGLSPQPGWIAGAFLGWRKSAAFALQLEGMISNKQSRTEMCTMGCIATGEVSLWFLEVPFLLRLDLLPGATKFHVDVGPEAVITLGGGRTDSLSGMDERFDDLFPFNLGLVIGTGVEIAVGPGSITLDLRYKRWAFPITGSVTGEVEVGFGDGETKIVSSHQLVLVAGYAFP